MTTLAQLREDAIDRSDFNDSDFISETMWNRWLNRGATELWGFILSLKKGADILTTVQAPQNVTNASIALPTGWLRVQFVERDPGTYRAYFLDQIEAAAKHSARGYFIQGNTVRLAPESDSAGSYSLHYVGACPTLTADGDSLDSRLEQWNHYVSLRAAIYAKQREEVSAKALQDELGVIRQDIQRDVARRGGAKSTTIVDAVGFDPWGRR